MVELCLRNLERIAKIQPQLTILILLLALYGRDLVALLVSLKGAI